MRLASLAVLLALTGLFSDTSRADEELLVFVGALVDIREAPDPCRPGNDEFPAGVTEVGDDDYAPPTLGLECIRFDAVFEATYDILEVLVGSTTQEQISFSIADHYGFPGFAEFKHALLFVGVSEEETWLHKYQGYPVLRTVEDRWASCGNPYDDRIGDDPRHLQPISFLSPLTMLGQLSVHGAIRRFDERYVQVEGDRVVCREGVYLDDLYSMVRDGVLSARGIDAPELASDEP